VSQERRDIPAADRLASPPTAADLPYRIWTDWRDSVAGVDHARRATATTTTPMSISDADPTSEVDPADDLALG
jgi:hypothetical protein